MNESEEYKCNCLECQQGRLDSLEWNSFVPLTNLQKRMKEVVKKIEDREKNKEKKRKVHPS